MENLFGAAELAAKAVLLSSLAVGVKTNHRAIKSALKPMGGMGKSGAGDPQGVQHAL